MLQYWDDSCRLTDEKWKYFFSEKIPQAQCLIAGILGLSAPERITFAPNTHELAYRLLSCLPRDRELQILTTDSEFHSWDRQLSRIAEDGRVRFLRVPSEPFESFEERFAEAARSQKWDVIYFSQVFFNSGVCVRDLTQLVDAAGIKKVPDTILIVDGYHGFMAVPTDLRALEGRIFYLAGAYKYAQAGEGCCFMVSPKTDLRPEYTGWFAEAAHLENRAQRVTYPDDGMRFAGATMDFSGLYRLISVLELFEREKITVPVIHRYVQELQSKFLQQIDSYQHPVLNRKNLIFRDLKNHGHFLTFRCPDANVAQELGGFLRSHGILTDSRGDRLRFGFGLYHDPANYDLSCLAKPRP